MSNWEKVKIVGGLLASVLIPLTVVFVGHEYSKATKEREIGAKYVELAIGILRSPPLDEYYDVRAWAVEVVVRHSDVPLTSTQKEYLKRTGVLEDIGAVVVAPSTESAFPSPQTPSETQPRPPSGVTVPNVRGLTVLEAREVLLAAGLSPDMGEQPDTAVVNVQEPRAGTRVRSGTVAKVEVAPRSAIPVSRLFHGLKTSPLPDP